MLLPLPHDVGRRIIRVLHMDGGIYGRAGRAARTRRVMDQLCFSVPGRHVSHAWGGRSVQQMWRTATMTAGAILIAVMGPVAIVGM